MKTAIVTPDAVGPVNNGGIGTFTYHFARLLRGAGYEVVLVFTGPLENPHSEWEHLYSQRGIRVIYAPGKPTTLTGFSYEPFMQTAEHVWQVLPPDVDVVYFQEWQANGFHLARQRRYRRDKSPVIVTVLHSNTDWIRDGMEQMPLRGYRDLSIAFAERYVAQHSDFVVAPSRYMIDWVREHGWRLPSQERVRVLGLPFPDSDDGPPLPPAPAYARLIYFGRLTTRKGIDLFIEAVKALHQEAPGLFAPIEEIVLMGKEAPNHYGDAKAIAAALAPLPATVITTYGHTEALAYLRAHAADSLVVIPSRADNFPYVVIEVSRVPGLNMICSGVGGIPEILGAAGAHQLFDPYAREFKPKLREALTRGPLPDEGSARYDAAHHNRLWLDFHEMVGQFAQQQRPITPPTLPDGPLVDVCVPYYNLGDYLPQALASLANQTVSNFTVTVIDDGSTQPDAVTVFEQMRGHYEPRGWRFIRTENRGVGHARNTAASYGTAPHLIFCDADNVAVPGMVERFVNAIRTSGDDVLTCQFKAFTDDGPPYTLTDDGEIAEQVSIAYVMTPLGNCPEAGMLENPYGDGNFIIRRDVFEATGGFPDDVWRYHGAEDRVYLTTLSLAGYALDVIPAYLFYYRHRAAGKSRSTSLYRNEMRVQALYRQKLRQVGLQNLTPMILGMSYFRFEPDWMAEFVSIRMIGRAVWLKVKKRLRRLIPR